VEKIIVTTPDELRKIIEDAISASLKQDRKKEPVVADHLSLDDAVAFLKQSGFPTSKTKIYRLTSTNGIPYKKYGNKLVFSRKKLLDWALQKTVDVGDNYNDIPELIKNIK